MRKRSARAIFRFVSLSFLAFLATAPFAAGALETSQENPPGSASPLAELREDTLSYFTPLTGKIVSVEGSSVLLEVSSPRDLKHGMRLLAFKEGASFIHPVTRESLGKIEVPVGSVEVTGTEGKGARGTIITGKPEDFVNALVKLPGTGIKVLFSQGTVEWNLGDAYYQLLRESERFELMGTGADTADIRKMAAEAKAKGAEVLLVLESEDAPDRTVLTQKLYWVGDVKQFAEKKVSVDVSRMKDLRFKAGLFGPKDGEALLSFSLPSGANRLSVADLDGDGSPEILLVTGSTVRIYKPGVDLKMTDELRIPDAEEVLWIDTIDSNGNGRDEVLLTTMQRGSVTSAVYEVQEGRLVSLWKAGDSFIRKIGHEVLIQQFSRSEGYEGGISSLVYDGGSYRKGERLKLPPNLNIFDFQFLHAPDGKRAVLTWDDKGYLNLYNEKGIRLWRSSKDYGGFSTSFKRAAPTVMVDRGSWSVKDRLVLRDGEVLVPKRIPLVGVSRSLGYSGSEIKSLWWNGVSVEERPFIEKTSGEVLDYSVMGDRIIVLSKVPFYKKAAGLLKGENPLGSRIVLYVYSLKGR
ncbi:MAG: VCBS repeat-containing protein [Nitrospirales bacterium]|nr:VCBS repeat-containing protein [Nitrospirales bacterium]